MQTGTQANEVEGDGLAARRSEVATTLMQELSPNERLFVVLRYGERLEVLEIATVMHCTEQHVLETLSGIESRLRQLVECELAELGPTLNPSS